LSYNERVALRASVFALLLSGLPGLGGCSSSELQLAGAPPPSTYLVTFDGEPSDAELGQVRLRTDVCRGADLKPPGRPLDADDFVAFLKAHGASAKVVQARSDLVFVDVDAGTPTPVRFRVAITSTVGAAGRELHTALLQRGRGAWGLQRSNLAVLAPAAPADDVVVYAAKLGLACWGVLMIAGHDDTFVVPGGYTEI
jgi:hypothetical protein